MKLLLAIVISLPLMSIHQATAPPPHDAFYSTTNVQLQQIAGEVIALDSIAVCEPATVSDVMVAYRDDGTIPDEAVPKRGGGFASTLMSDYLTGRFHDYRGHACADARATFEDI